MKQSLMIPLVLLAVFSAQMVPIYAADSSIIQVSTGNIYLKQGQENTIRIMLKNTGDYKCFDVESFLSSPTQGLSVLSNAQKVINEIEAGKTKTYEPTLYVDQNLPLGSYTLTLNVIYMRFAGSQPNQITVPISVVVDEPYSPRITYSGSNTPGISTGATSDIEYSFKNTVEGALSNVEFSISSPVPQITILEGDTIQLESVETGADFAITPKISVLPGAQLMVYTLTATASYRDQEGNRYYQSFNLPLLVDSEKPSKSTIVTLKEIAIDETVYPGEVFQVNLMVECTGADAYDLMAVLGGDISGNLSPLSPTTVMLGDIPAGETLNFNYELLAKGDITAGQYPLSVTLAYINNKGTPATLTEKVTVQVEGLIDFQLLDLPNIDAQAGQTTEFEADLLLIGTESVEFVSIEVVEDENIQAVSGSEEYIGAVDPDSPIPFDLNFKVDQGTALGSHDLTLRINYRDHLNQEHSENIKVPMNIIDPVPESNNNEKQGIFSWILSILGMRK